MKTTDGNINTPKLPEEVRSLITRKLRMLRHEQNRDWQKVVLTARQELRGEISDAIFEEGIRGKWISTVRSVYRNLTTEAITVSKEWPSRVWETIYFTLVNTKVGSLSAGELEGIVDESAWHFNNPPFTLKYIEAQKFREMAKEPADLFCLDMEAAFGRWYDLEVTACLSNIQNEARRAREAVSIAIEEFVIAHRQNATVATPNLHPVIFVKREAGKLKTQAMYLSWQKMYLVLKKKHPTYTGGAISKLIAKLDIAQGKSAGYIRKKMLEQK